MTDAVVEALKFMWPVITMIFGALFGHRLSRRRSSEDNIRSRCIDMLSNCHLHAMNAMNKWDRYAVNPGKTIAREVSNSLDDLQGQCEQASRFFEVACRLLALTKSDGDVLKKSRQEFQDALTRGKFSESQPFPKVTVMQREREGSQKSYQEFVDVLVSLQEKALRNN